MPLILSLFLALCIASRISFRPMFLNWLPAICPNISSWPCSSMLPERLSTSTELFNTGREESDEAIIPTILIMAKKPVTKKNAKRPVTVAAVYFKKSFICPVLINRIITVSFAKIAFFDEKQELCLIKKYLSSSFILSLKSGNFVDC